MGVQRVRSLPIVASSLLVALSLNVAAAPALASAALTPVVPFPAVRDWKTLRIKLERRGVLPNPSYTIQVLGNGDVIFNGEPSWGILIAGHHHDSIPHESVARLLSAFRESDYFSLKDSYRSPHLTDSPTYTTTVEFDGHKKEVVDESDAHFGLPEAVTKVENLIDEIAGTDRWLRGTPETVRSLMREHWNFRANTSDNDLLFLAAIRKPEILRLYVERGFPPIQSPKMAESPLVSAALSEDASILTHLIGYRRQLPERLATRALMSAAVGGWVENIRILIAHGANPDGDDHGTTVLEFAVLSGKVEAVNEILKHHPNIKRSDRSGHGVISFLLDHGVPAAAQEKLIPILIRAGANASARGGYSEDGPLFILSANQNCPALLEVLLDAGADVNARDALGESPLMEVGNHAECAKALIAHGANLSARDKQGRTALDVAHDGNNNDVAKVIEAAMAR